MGRSTSLPHGGSGAPLPSGRCRPSGTGAARKAVSSRDPITDPSPNACAPRPGTAADLRASGRPHCGAASEAPRTTACPRRAGAARSTPGSRDVCLRKHQQCGTRGSGFMDRFHRSRDGVVAIEQDRRSLDDGDLRGHGQGRTPVALVARLELASLQISRLRESARAHPSDDPAELEARMKTCSWPPTPEACAADLGSRSIPASAAFIVKLDSFNANEEIRAHRRARERPPVGGLPAGASQGKPGQERLRQGGRWGARARRSVVTACGIVVGHRTRRRADNRWQINWPLENLAWSRHRLGRRDPIEDR